MATVVGRFRVGFVASPEFEDLSPADKADFKSKVWTEIKTIIPEADRNMFNIHPITVDGGGHATEPVIQGVIDGILNGFTYGGAYKLVRDTNAGVRYGVWNNTRECVHDFFLDMQDTNTGKRQDWEVVETYGPVRVEVQLYCSYAWDTALTP